MSADPACIFSRPHFCLSRACLRLWLQEGARRRRSQRSGPVSRSRSWVQTEPENPPCLKTLGGEIPPLAGEITIRPSRDTPAVAPPQAGRQIDRPPHRGGFPRKSQRRSPSRSIRSSLSVAWPSAPGFSTPRRISRPPRRPCAAPGCQDLADRPITELSARRKTAGADRAGACPAQPNHAARRAPLLTSTLPISSTSQAC